jgi:hypothetical protein
LFKFNLELNSSRLEDTAQPIAHRTRVSSPVALVLSYSSLQYNTALALALI